MSPALAGRFFTTALHGKSSRLIQSPTGRLPMGHISLSFQGLVCYLCMSSLTKGVLKAKIGFTVTFPSVPYIPYLLQEAFHYDLLLLPIRSLQKYVLFRLSLSSFSLILKLFYLKFSQFSRSVVSDSLWPHGLQHARPPCPTLTPGVYPNSCLSSWWCHPTISSSIFPFSSCLQSFPASGSFLMSWLFTSGGQSIGASAVLPMNIKGWFPFGLTGLTSLQSKGLSRVLSSTTVQKHQFFSAWYSLWPSSHICTWLLE